MTTIRRLRWQGPARVSACTEAVRTRFAAWLADWQGDVEVELVAVSNDAVAGGTGHGFERGGAKLWYVAEPADIASLGAWLTGVVASDGVGLAMRLAERALEDLAHRLLPPAGEGLRRKPAPAPIDLVERYGALVFAVEGLTGFRVVLDLATCEALVPTPPRTSAPLTPRGAAIADQPARLEVSLSIGSVALAEASSLAVGEVLLAGALTDLSVQVGPAGATPVLRGALRRQGDRFAVAITSRHS